jgi:hypothetical protein
MIFLLDREKVKAAQTSHAFLTARPVCKVESCDIKLRISYRDIAEGLNVLTPQAQWQGTTGVLSATISKDSTQAELETFKIKTQTVSFDVKAFKYSRVRGTNESNVVMTGTIGSKVFPDTDFSIQGNIRDSSTIKIMFGGQADPTGVAR